MDPNTKQPGTGGQPNPQPGQEPEWQQPPASTVISPQPQAVQPNPQPDAVASGPMPAAQPPVYGGQMPDTPGPAPVMPPANGPGGRSRLTLIGIAVAVVLVAAAVAAYMVLGNKDNGSTDANNAAKNSSNASADKDAIAVSSLSAVTFTPPTDLSGFRPNSSTDSAYHVYLTEGASENQACSLEFGTLAADALPGDDLNDIIAPQIENFKKTGATIEGPSAGTALVLKDANDASVTYSLPTLDYKMSKDGKHVDVHYSLAILQGGRRAFVSRQCLGTGDVTSILAKVEAAAKRITVQKQ